MNRFLIATLAACWLMIASAPEAKAWGAARVGYTYHGAGGYYHTSTRAAYGPYGMHTVTGTGGYSPYAGVYRTGYGVGYRGTAYGYSTGYGGYGGYSTYGGYHATYGGVGAYGGVYRRW
jgi:hypothetical protein